MKILIVNTYEISGGTARAANCLHRLLLNQGIDRQMLVQKKIRDDYSMIDPFSKKEKWFKTFLLLIGYLGLIDKKWLLK